MHPSSDRLQCDLSPNQIALGGVLAVLLLARIVLFAMHTLSRSIVIGFLFTATIYAQDAGFKPLFNGRDLDGWVRVNTAESTWKVEEGMLICSGKPIGELRTNKMYQNFIFEVEWRHMKPKGNAGVFVWADDITSRGVPFHRSIEIQVLENAYGNTRGYTTHGDIFPIHGATMKPVNGRGGKRAFPTENRSNASPEWNHYRVECRDGAVSLAVNGKVVTRGTDCSPRKGYLCIESEGGTVHYRNIRIKELPDTPVDEADVAIADRGYRCLYHGIDLENWNAVGAWKPRDWTLKYEGDSVGSLTTKERFLGESQVLFDIRASDAWETLAVAIGETEIMIAADDPAVAEQLQKWGRWNRFEVKYGKNQISVELNGQSVLVKANPNATPTGPLTLKTSGPMDFSNIYIRKLLAHDS